MRPAGGDARTVRLLVSKDRGATWNAISDAQPHVKAFHYRAESEGEYWFAVRTIDSRGQAWPQGTYQPELRVIVDTTPPQIAAFDARAQGGEAIELIWSVTDANLNAASLRLELQHGAPGSWEPAALAAPATHDERVGGWRALWPCPPGRVPSAARITMADHAGNVATRSATIVPVSDPVAAAATPSPTANSGWASSTASQTNPPPGSPTLAETPVSQPWPAATPLAPYRLFGDAATIRLDGETRYGNPSRCEASATADSIAAVEPSATTHPVEPFRHAAFRRLPMIDESATQLPPGIEPKHVGSRTFALDYDLADAGRWGVTRVEVWGTRDAGSTWRRFAQDEDRRSPVEVTVESEGLYGFRIAAEAAGGTPPAPPQAGEPPALWVEVDLHRPFAELTSVEPGQGNQADHLILRWLAEDANLDSQPVSLFYSSRPAGPWSVIATSLHDTGYYAWRIERHVPERCYLRLEVRDKAGNLGAYQTIEPIAIEIGGAQKQARLSAGR
jgi:hypothetical protein